MAGLYHWFWDNGARYLLYGLLVILGLWTSKNIMMSALKTKFQEWNYRYRLRRIRNRTDFSTAPTYNHPILRHINLLLRTTRDERNENDVLVFVVFSVLLGVTSALFLFFFVMQDIVVTVLLSSVIMFIPYLFLRLRLNRLRYLLSLEFLGIVQKVAQNYNAFHYDMYHALTETQKEIKTRELRKVIIKLITDLQVARNEKELRESIQVFTYTAGTNWAKRFGSIILKAYLHKENVLNAMLTLIEQMEDTEEMLEEEKSSTMEHVFNGYATLPIFIASLFLGYFVSGAQDWFKLQFGHQATLLMFILCLVGVIFSIIISIFLKSPKNDL